MKKDKFISFDGTNEHFVKKPFELKKRPYSDFAKLITATKDKTIFMKGRMLDKWEAFEHGLRAETLLTNEAFEILDI